MCITGSLVPFMMQTDGTQTSFLFLEQCAGFKDALCIWRCIEFFVHDPRILRKTGQCFALNGAIFLGSVLLWERVMAPGARFLLAASLKGWGGGEAVDATLALLHALFLALWLLPVYCVSFALSCVWYQEIAELAVQWQRRQARGAPPAAAGGGGGGGGHKDVLDAAAQEVFRVALFAVFFLQVSAVAFVPVLGGPAYFVLVSWLYALYSFDYKWSLTSRRLQDRISFIEEHWAFFLGFGSVCTLATMYWTFWKGAAIMAMVYPLFILVACKSEPLRAYQRAAEAEAAAGRRLRMGRAPVFAAATRATALLLQRAPAAIAAVSAAPGALWRARRALAAAAVALAALVLALRVRGRGAL